MQAALLTLNVAILTEPYVDPMAFPRAQYGLGRS